MCGIKLLIHCQTSPWSLDKWFHPTLSKGCEYLSMLGLKLIQVRKRGPKCRSFISTTTANELNATYLEMGQNCRHFVDGILWFIILNDYWYTLRWRHNGRDSVSNHQPHDCLLQSLFRPRSKNTSKLRVTGLCAGNSPGTGEFPSQMASNAENVSISWRHHDLIKLYSTVYSGADHRKHQSSASLAFVVGIQRWPVNSPHKWPVTRKMFLLWIMSWKTIYIYVKIIFLK